MCYQGLSWGWQSPWNGKSQQLLIYTVKAVTFGYMTTPTFPLRGQTALDQVLSGLTCTLQWQDKTGYYSQFKQLLFSKHNKLKTGLMSDLMSTGSNLNVAISQNCITVNVHTFTYNRIHTQALGEYNKLH